MEEGLQPPDTNRDLERENRTLRAEIDRLRKILAANGLPSASALANTRETNPQTTLRQQENRHTRAKQRIALFRNLFRGREDVYAKRWTNVDGRSGYSPAALVD